jgi:hypothetical protein
MTVEFVGDDDDGESIMKCFNAGANRSPSSIQGLPLEFALTLASLLPLDGFRVTAHRLGGTSGGLANDQFCIHFDLHYRFLT